MVGALQCKRCAGAPSALYGELGSALSDDRWLEGLLGGCSQSAQGEAGGTGPPWIIVGEWQAET